MARDAAVQGQADVAGREAGVAGARAPDRRAFLPKSYLAGHCAHETRSPGADVQRLLAGPKHSH